MKTLKPNQIQQLAREDLERRIPKALERLQLLQGELEVKKTEEPDPSEPHVHYTQRKLLIRAHGQQLTEYRRLKDERHRRNQAVESPSALLAAALTILRDVEELTPEELLVCHRIEAWLLARAKPSPAALPDDRPAD